MILIFTIHSFSLSDPTTAISFNSFFFFFLLSHVFWSSLPLFSSFSSSPIYHQIPIFPHPKPHHNRIFKTSSQPYSPIEKVWYSHLLAKLWYSHLVSLISFLSLSALFSSKDASSGLLLCVNFLTLISSYLLIYVLIVSIIFIFFSFFFFSLRLIFCYWTCTGRILHFGRISPKWTGMPETHRNRPEFYPRWNRGVCHSGLHTDTKFSSHSGRNGTKLITMVQTTH